MTTYEIEYIKTGSGEAKKTDRVWISLRDEYADKKVHNIMDAIECFEWIAANNWGTYETKNAIVNIKAIER